MFWQSSAGSNVAGAIEQEAARRQQERIQRIARAWSAYAGDLPKPLKVQIGRPDDNVMLALCGLVVDKGVSFLFGDGIEFETQDEGSETWLEGFWEQNKAAATLHNIGTNGGVCGDAFVRLRVEPGLQYPRIINIDPQTIYALTDADDYERVIEYRIEWAGVDPRTGKARARRQTVTRAESGASWEIVDYVSEGNNTRWTELSREVWPYEWCPIFHCQNLPAPNEFYGRSDIEAEVQGLNCDVNFVASNVQRIIRFHAHPKTVGSGVGPGELDVSVDSVIKLGNPDAKLYNLEMASDLGSSMEFMRRLSEAFHAVTRVPEVATGRTEDLGALSGVALQILFQPLIEKTQTKQLMYGGMLTDLSQRALELGGRPNVAVTIGWPKLLPSDPKTEGEAATLWQTIGVSTATILNRLGFDAEKEMAERAKEDAEKQATEAEVGDRLMQAFERGQMTGRGRMGGPAQEGRQGGNE